MVNDHLQCEKPEYNNHITWVVLSIFWPTNISADTIIQIKPDQTELDEVRF